MAYIFLHGITGLALSLTPRACRNPPLSRAASVSLPLPLFPWPVITPHASFHAEEIVVIEKRVAEKLVALQTPEEVANACALVHAITLLLEEQAASNALEAKLSHHYSLHPPSSTFAPPPLGATQPLSPIFTRKPAGYRTFAPLFP